MDVELNTVVDELLDRISRHWNASEVAGIARAYHPDADYVDVLGRHFRGRAAIAGVHRRNFDTIHRDSKLQMTRIAARPLREGLALAHVRSYLQVPSGYLAGESMGIMTMVIERITETETGDPEGAPEDSPETGAERDTRTDVGDAAAEEAVGDHAGDAAAEEAVSEERSEAHPAVAAGRTARWVIRAVQINYTQMLGSHQDGE